MAEWNEAEHPRDDDGKFTYKNGGNQQSDKQGAANEFDKWIYSKGKISQGLINRRKIEKKLFLTPDK